jgi:sulfinoalanine decarboxylase
VYENQITVVGFGAFENETFVRLVTVNANNEKLDILNFFKVLEAYVEKTPNLTRIEEVV